MLFVVSPQGRLLHDCMLMLVHLLQASEKATKAKDAGVQKKKASPKKKAAPKGEAAEKKPAAKKAHKVITQKSSRAPKQRRRRGAAKK